ncbi:MAG: MBL fold metallo-hydrolase [Bdellovibrionota bacterium]
MKRELQGLYSIRGIVGCCHLLVDDAGCVLIDAGLIGERFQIARIMRRLGLPPDSLRALLLTHGHLDHTGNLAWAKRFSGAPVYAHALEQAHVAGAYEYHGVARWCGRLERIGRLLILYEPVSIDHFIEDGEVLPFWGGLRVVHLPGHTAGHCGFYSESRNLLFSGDMFASYFFMVHRPPPIINSAPELFPDSYRKMRALNPELVIPGHYDFCDGSLHRRRFDRYVDYWIKKFS